jgi:cytochrome c5
MEEQTDKVFIRNVSIVIGLLVAFAITIAFLALGIGVQDHSVNNPSRQTSIEERIKPVGGVYAGEAGASAIEQAAAEAATGSVQAVAFDGSLDSEMIYNNVCSACHATGAAGAPMLGSADMLERAGKGLEALSLSVINGLNAMPPRGGRPDLSDEQIQAAVEFMLK